MGFLLLEFRKWKATGGSWQEMYFSAKNPFLSWNLTPREFSFGGDIIDWESPKNSQTLPWRSPGRSQSSLSSISRGCNCLRTYKSTSLWRSFEMSCDGPLIAFLCSCQNCFTTATSVPIFYRVFTTSKCVRPKKKSRPKKARQKEEEEKSKCVRHAFSSTKCLTIYSYFHNAHVWQLKLSDIVKIYMRRCQIEVQIESGRRPKSKVIF